MSNVINPLDYWLNTDVSYPVMWTVMFNPLDSWVHTGVYYPAFCTISHWQCELPAGSWYWVVDVDKTWWQDKVYFGSSTLDLRTWHQGVLGGDVMKHTMDHTILQNSEQVRMGQEFVTGLEASEARMKTNNEEIYCSVVCDVNGLFYFKTGKHD